MNFSLLVLILILVALVVICSYLDSLSKLAKTAVAELGTIRLGQKVKRPGWMRDR